MLVVAEQPQQEHDRSSKGGSSAGHRHTSGRGSDSNSCRSSCYSCHFWQYHYRTSISTTVAPSSWSAIILIHYHKLLASRRFQKELLLAGDPAVAAGTEHSEGRPESWVYPFVLMAWRRSATFNGTDPPQVASRSGRLKPGFHCLERGSRRWLWCFCMLRSL